MHQMTYCQELYFQNLVLVEGGFLEQLRVQLGQLLQLLQWALTVLLVLSQVMEHMLGCFALSLSQQ
jgi:hypothetical protein